MLETHILKRMLIEYLFYFLTHIKHIQHYIRGEYQIKTLFIIFTHQHQTSLKYRIFLCIPQFPSSGKFTLHILLITAFSTRFFSFSCLCFLLSYFSLEYSLSLSYFLLPPSPAHTQISSSLLIHRNKAFPLYAYQSSCRPVTANGIISSVSFCYKHCKQQFAFD